MPISFNSPARNFFLLAASGQQEITAFIRRITTPSSSDTFGYEPARIEYQETDQKYLVAGSQIDAQDDLYEGFLTKANEVGTKTFDIKLQSTETSVDYGTTIRSMAQDSNGNIIVCGRKGEALSDTAGAPYVGKFNSDGLSIWFQSTNEVSENARVEYTDISVDSNDDIYVIGYTPTSVNESILSKYLSDGTIVWSKKLLDDGSDGFQDFKFRNVSVNSRDELIVTGSLEGTTKTKGVVAKYDVFGNQIWIKTFEDNELATSSSYRNVVINSSYVDGNDYIYCAGYSEDSVASKYKGVVFRLTPEGNILWQQKTNYINSIQYTSISADTLTGQAVVAGEVWTGSEGFTFTQRYNGAGQLTWTRKISSTNARSAYVDLTSDPSYYYIIYADETQQATDPESFLYGKLSITGNGLGAFTYNDGVADQNYLVTNIPVKTGTLADGSLRNDASDFITYPYNAVKVLFDDLTMIYQPKQPVHDGSDHEITTVNMLTTSDIVVLADDTSVIDTSSFVYIYGTTGGTGVGSTGGFDLGGTYHLRFGSLSNAEHQSAGYSGTSESTAVDRKFDTFPLDLRRVASFSLETIRGTDTNGGEDPDITTENLRLYYSIDGGNTFTFADSITIFNQTQVGNTLYINSVNLPLAAKTNSTILRVVQIDHSGTGFDHWGITKFSLLGDVVSSPEAPKISADGIVYGSNLLLNYDFNNLATYSGSGSSVYNLSSTSYTGTINGTTFNADGYFDFGTTSQQNLISTTGTNCSTLLGTTDSGGSCTIECWVNLDDTFTRQTILSGYIGGDNMRWDLEVSSGNLQFIRHANGTTSGTGGVSAFDWSHIVVTRGDGTDARIRIYLNGSEVGTSLLGGPLGSGVPLGLGMRADGSTDFPLDGKIAEVRTYTRFLSATEVSQNFNATRDKYGV